MFSFFLFLMAIASSQIIEREIYGGDRDPSLFFSPVHLEKVAKFDCNFNLTNTTYNFIIEVHTIANYSFDVVQVTGWDLNKTNLQYVGLASMGGPVFNVSGCYTGDEWTIWIGVGYSNISISV